MQIDFRYRDVRRFDVLQEIIINIYQKDQLILDIFEDQLKFQVIVKFYVFKIQLRLRIKRSAVFSYNIYVSQFII